MTRAAQRIRDAAAEGDFARAAALWNRHRAEFQAAQLPELIAIVRQAASELRARAWVAQQYHPNPR